MYGAEAGLRKSLYGFSFWSSTFCLSLSWTHVQGNMQLIGSSQPIVAAPGDDAVLPCRVDPEWDAVGKTVEWSRPDLRPSGTQRPVEYVFMYRYKKTERDMMMETYIQRTSLSEGLRHGDVSLSIRNVSLEDNGRFRCYIPSLDKEAEVLLVVDPNFDKMTTTETVPDRNPITPTQQEETSRNTHRSRLLLCLPVLIFFFFVCLSAVSICRVKKSLKNNKFSRTSVTQTPHLHPECLALQPTCVDVDGSSAESGSSCGFSRTLQEAPKPPDQRSITASGFADMKRTSGEETRTDQNSQKPSGPASGFIWPQDELKHLHLAGRFLGLKSV